MGARGKLKLATGLTIVPDGTAAADVPALAPRKPKTVADNSDLSDLWDEIVPELDRAGLVSVSDAAAIELALRHFLVARLASDSIGSEVAVADEHNAGTMKKNPAEAVFRLESDMFLKYAQQLGMTFVSRARTPAAKGDGEDVNPFSQSV